MWTLLGGLLALAAIGVLLVIGVALVQFLAIFAAVPLLALGVALRPVCAPMWRVVGPRMTPITRRVVAWTERASRRKVW